MLVDAIEYVMCGFHRQRRHSESLAVSRDGGDTRSDAKTNVVGPTQFANNSVYLLSVHPLRVENGFCIIEDKNGRMGVRSSGFSTPAPMTLERR